MGTGTFVYNSHLNPDQYLVVEINTVGNLMWPHRLHLDRLVRKKPADSVATRGGTHSVLGQVTREGVGNRTTKQDL